MGQGVKRVRFRNTNSRYYDLFMSLQQLILAFKFY
jgi:hypothetical protein